MHEIKTLEQEVMQMLLEGNEPVLCTLSVQFRQSVIENRELSGVGFFTSFSIPPEVPRLSDSQDFHFGDVQAEIDGLQNGAGFVLHIKDGAIDYLEGYSYDEPWPSCVDHFRLSYAGGGTRNFDELRKKWSRSRQAP